MLTEFSKVYERAIFKFTDFGFLNSSDVVKTAVLKNHLMSAIIDFKHSCKEDISNYDLENERFNIELDDEIIEILATGIAYHWLKSKALNTELMKNLLHKSDFKSYSPANLLQAIKALCDTYEQDYRGKIITYSHRFGNVDTRKV